MSFLSVTAPAGGTVLPPGQLACCPESSRHRRRREEPVPCGRAGLRYLVKLVNTGGSTLGRGTPAARAAS